MNTYGSAHVDEALPHVDYSRHKIRFRPYSQSPAAGSELLNDVFIKRLF